MQRKIATLPDSVTELCLVRLGLQVRKFTAWPYVRRLGKAIDRSSKEALAADVGLLHSEQFFISWNHFGSLQYWRTFDAMEQWSHRPPHSERADLAVRLIESLDAEAEDEDAAAFWESEIRARLEDLDQGKVQTVPWSEARRMILDDGDESSRD